MNKIKSNELINNLNQLLSDLQVFYINTKGFHWNAKGDKFFDLHAKFEDLYNHLNKEIDDVAERIIMLGGNPYLSYSEYLTRAKIKETKEIITPQMSVRNVITSLEIIINYQNKIIAFAHEISDWGTIMMIGKDVLQKEKMLWMFTAFNEKNIVKVNEMSEAI